MQQFSQKYTIVQFLDEVVTGDEFASNEWPLHSTIIDTFAIDWLIDEMIGRLADGLAGYGEVRSVATDDRFFGDEQQTQVTLLERSDSLVTLHLAVLAILENGGLVLNDPQFSRDGFLPHSTVQKNARLQKGDGVRFTALSIVDMFPNADAYVRKVLATISLV